MDLTLHVWRQNGPNDKGRFDTLPANDISEHNSEARTTLVNFTNYCSGSKTNFISRIR